MVTEVVVGNVVIDPHPCGDVEVRLEGHGVLTPNQVTVLADALLRVAPGPEPKKWKTVGIHGRGPSVPGWAWLSGASGPRWRSTLDDLIANTSRYLPAADSGLPAWDDVEPAPEPELPAPWLTIDTLDDLDARDVTYAWAYDDGEITLERGAPSRANPHVVAWCAISVGESVPPHPRAEQ